MPILTAEERIGTLLAGKYRLERILGRGGFGIVYAGTHEWTNRAIAVKLLSHEFSQQPSFVKRFLQEARAAAKLKHPNVVDVLDMGQDADGSVYLVLELLEGHDLTKQLRQHGRLTVQQTIDTLGPVMDALADAHDHGIVHRDIKPDNIFISVDSKGRTIPKLLDFGIAKVTDGGATHTSTGMIIGTPHYMSPEQARGRSDLGPPADVWSMAVVIWHCLSGTLPFDAESPTGVLAEILTRRAAPFSRVAPHVPRELAAVLDRALDPDPRNRFPHMRAFLDALHAVASSASPGRDHTGPTAILSSPDTSQTPMHWSSQVPAEPAPAKQEERRGFVLVAAASALLVVGGLAGGFAFWAGGEAPEPDRSTTGRPTAPELPTPPSLPSPSPPARETEVAQPTPPTPTPAPVAAEPVAPAAASPSAVAEPTPEPAPAATPAATSPERTRTRRAPEPIAPIVRPMAPEPAPIAPPPVVQPVEPRPAAPAPAQPCFRTGPNGALLPC